VLLRDAAYGAMSKSRRAELHEGAARLLAPAPDREAERAASHLERAVGYRRELGLDRDRTAALAAEAAETYAAVGRRALAAADVPRAVHSLTHAVDLFAADDPRRPEVALALGDALADSGEAARADYVLREVEESASGRTALHARLARLQHRPYRELASRPVLREVEAAETTFDRARDEAGLARCASVRARVDHAHCRFAAKSVALEQLLEHAVAANDERLQRAARVDLALTIVAGPERVDEALERLERLQAAAQDDRAAAASSLCARGMLEAMAGRVSEGRELAEEGCRMLDDLGLASAHADATAFLAQIELLAGRPDVAAALLAPAVDRARENGDAQRFGILSAHLGDALLALGRAEAAERYARAARGASTSDDMATRIHWRCLEAGLLARQGRIPGGVKRASEALSLARTTDLLELHAATAMTLFELASAAHDARAAERAIDEALDCYTRKGNRLAAERAETLLEAGHQSGFSP
jgi:tetratricopeptide (TPR) repeat protein